MSKLASDSVASADGKEVIEDAIAEPRGKAWAFSIGNSTAPSPLKVFTWLVLSQRPLRSLLLKLTAAAGIGLMGFEPILLKHLFDLLQSQQQSSFFINEAFRLFG